MLFTNRARLSHEAIDEGDSYAGMRNGRMDWARLIWKKCSGGPQVKMFFVVR